MSLNKSAIRLSLLAGSSLAAMLTSHPAFAANECAPVGVSPAANGSTPDTYACSGATTYQTTGITYSSSGDLTVDSTGAMNVGTVGVNLAGSGPDDVKWTATGAVTGTLGPVIDVTAGTGDIDIITAGVTATAVGATHAIRATATGAGDITITRSSGAVLNNGATTGQNAIEAVTNGGDIVYSDTGIGATTGRLRGILAQTSGAGSVSITKGGGNVTVSATEAVAGIDVITGTGGLTMMLNVGGISGGSGHAIRIVSPVAASITIQGGSINGSVDFSGMTGAMTLNITSGQWSAVRASVFTGQADTATLLGSLGAGASIDFAGGADRVNINGSYTANAGSILFGAGADRMDIAGVFTANGAQVQMDADADTLNVSGRFVATGGVFDFGSGADVLNLTGQLAVNGQGGLTLTSLEAFNNSSVIYMGGTTGTATDGAADDTLAMTGGTFTGSGSSRIAMDVLLAGATPQSGCATLTGAADCLDLRGASTAGVTLITINDVTADGAIQGGLNGPVTLVDVGGAGASAAGHFVLDPNSEGYAQDRILGDVVTRPGLVVYDLVYDAANQRHVLASAPRAEVLEYAVLSSAAQSIWHMTAHTVTDRQSDLRDGAEEGSVWVRTAGEYTQRDVATDFLVGGAVVTADNSYKLYAGTIMGGMDLISGERGAVEYAAGVQIGYVSSSFDLNESDTSGRFSGGTGGAYASAWSDWFFADAAVNLNGLTLDYDSPGLGSKSNTFLNSIGAKAEAGVRTMLSERTFAEPLLTVSWVRTSFEEISLSGGEVQPADAESLRGALGLRLGGTLSGQSASATYFVTGRTWEEFEGENSGVVHNPGADLPFTDDFAGVFGEAEVGVNVYNSANTLSGFLTGGVKFKDGYTATALSLGLRMAW